MVSKLKGNRSFWLNFFRPEHLLSVEKFELATSICPHSAFVVSSWKNCDRVVFSAKIEN